MMKTRGRFAPTPSGQMHIGNAWTALLAWWQIRQAGGEFVLRMEDVDKPRSRPEYAEQILTDLRWLGLDWDEGPDLGGKYAPYTQSEREGLYEAAMEQLLRDGWLYPCYCSRAELMAIASAPHGLSAEGPVYPGICRGLTSVERAEKAARKDPSYRFRVPDHPVAYEDLLAGRQAFEAGFGGDFVVKRADGIIGYQLAVVVDDAAMEITDVLRGYDLLDSTPRQLLLYEALGLEPPRFTHVPLLCGPGGERLSKRDKSLTLAAIRDAGTSAEQLVGLLAYLGGLLERPEPVRAGELIKTFDLQAIPKDPITLSEQLLQSLTSTGGV
ncbi:MAG TPA: tRNA glutamyl-Q(34) synthetase GluQRS [Bacilli bacterium]|nr:tRNA glutamyl-Q(34) synthetase GluQRS [Bacilli bacterium]